MIKELVKDAFDEGRQQGGDWEDSDAAVASRLLDFLNIEEATIRQRLPNGKFGSTFTDIHDIREWFEDNGLNFSKSNLETAICTGFKCGGVYWEIVV
jgi:hypothetical protein